MEHKQVTKKSKSNVLAKTRMSGKLQGEGDYDTSRVSNGDVVRDSHFTQRRIVECNSPSCRQMSKWRLVGMLASTLSRVRQPRPGSKPSWTSDFTSPETWKIASGTT